MGKQNGRAASSNERSLQAIPEGKVVDFITGRLMKDTPEEYVRQNVARSLVLEYGYDRAQIAVEFRIKIGSGSKRVDLAIFPEGEPHTQENISTIVETKKQNTSRESKSDGVGQLHSYMAASVNCTHGMWTNGLERLCYVKNAFEGKHRFEEAIDIPTPGSPVAEAPIRETLRPATADNLLFAFRRCHNYISGNQGLQKPEAFWELLKLIFCKIEDERSNRERLDFYVSQDERTSMSLQGRVKARIAKLFSTRVVKKYPTIFADSDNLEMSPPVLAYVVAELQNYSLLDSPVDVKGVAYEEIVGSNLRGDRGEFFTPRNACRMAVKMLDPQVEERVIDPAMGTGGFLVTAMNHVLAQLELHHSGRWRGKTPSTEQLSEYYHARNQFLSQNVFGFDLNPNLVKASKMNMVMNNDGSGSLFQVNSLEHPHRWHDDPRKAVPLGSIDVLFANPPFGTKIVIDDPRILAQYDLGAMWDETENGWEIRKGKDGKPLPQKSQPPEILFVERCLQLLRPGGRMAIVLPNGLLNNPGLAYLRSFIMREAQILAVIDMHRDLFQPRNDTQTSMVLLRKWASDEQRQELQDYPIFMAIADKVGHDKRGNTIFKRTPDGTLVLKETRAAKRRQTTEGEEEVEVVTKAPIVDDELDDVAEQFLAWFGEQAMMEHIGRRR